MSGKTKKTLIILLIAIVASVVSILGIVLISRSKSSCTVGVYGYAANVTFSGPDAQKICNQFIAEGIPDYSNSTGAKMLPLYSDSNPQGTQLCSGAASIPDNSAGYTTPIGGGIPSPNVWLKANYVVQDTGALMLIGHGLCDYFVSG